MQLEYVDVVFANRPDPNTPMEGKHACWDAVPFTRLSAEVEWFAFSVSVLFSTCSMATALSLPEICHIFTL